MDTIKATGKFDIFPYSEGRLAYLMFNENSDTKQLNKKEVRQALSYALNQDELIYFCSSGISIKKFVGSTGFCPRFISFPLLSMRL
ncbi:UNVERIFIED_CONTAM: ABC-type transport system substrate-binding protein [Paenibacillus sp. PvR008]